MAQQCVRQLCGTHFRHPLPIALNSEAVLLPLHMLLERLCAADTAAIAGYLQQAQAEQLFITPPAEPHIGCVPFGDKLYKLIIRFATPLPRRPEIQQAVLDKFLRWQHRLLDGVGAEYWSKRLPESEVSSKLKRAS